MNRHGIDIQFITSHILFEYARCETCIQRYDINVKSIHDRYGIDIRFMGGAYEVTLQRYTTLMDRYTIHIRSI